MSAQSKVTVRNGRLFASVVATTVALTLAGGLASATAAPLKQGTSAFTNKTTATASVAGTTEATGGRALKRGYAIGSATPTEAPTAPAPTAPAPTAPAPTAPAPTAPAPTAPAPTAPAPTTPAPSEKIVRQTGFENMSLGAAQPAQFNAALGGTNGLTKYYDDMSVVSDGTRGKVLRTTLDANTVNGLSAGNNGAVFFMPIPETDRACMQYDIKFDQNFNFSLGGKLPGLQGVVPGTDVAAPTGGHGTDNGWSGRMMWLGPKAYSWAGPSNMAVSYMYHAGQVSQYGDNIRWNKGFTAGKWHTVKQCYTMNTPGQANGVHEAWFDGVKVVDNHAFNYRTKDSVHISHISWSIFRGGGTMDWASPTTGTVDIDNVVVTAP